MLVPFPILDPALRNETTLKGNDLLVGFGDAFSGLDELLHREPAGAEIHVMGEKGGGRRDFISVEFQVFRPSSIVVCSG